MDPSRWQRLRSIYESATDLAPDRREDYVREACGDDEGLLREVRGMLRSEEEGAEGGAHADFLHPLTGADLGRTAPRPERGARIGGFRLGDVLAEGGMGTVYEAFQDEPRRKVALKLLRAGLSSASAVRRFRFEAELLARLRHPGIAPIHEAGVHEDERGVELPYLAMELVEDARDIVRYASEERLELGARVELFQQVLAAAQHGHQQGVVHRDLKPPNILVDRDGRARIIDFGIARAVGRSSALPELEHPETQLTGHGEILGTLGYMSPEQFTGDSNAIDTRSDVYSLGVVLHELLCGRPPHELAGRSLVELSRIVVEQPVPPPAELPEDLGWIVAKALAKDREERYASASEFAADLARFLADEPVEAGAPTRTYRLRKFVRRNRLPVAFATLAAVALVVGALAAVAGLLEARRAQRDLERQRDVAVAEATKFESLFDVLTGMLLAVSPEQNGRDVRVADLLDGAVGQLAALEDPEVAGVLHQVLGSSYRNLNLRPEAVEQYERSLALLDPIEELEPQILAAVRADLGRALAETDRVDEALTLVELGLREARDGLPADDPARFSLEAVRADALVRSGEHDVVLEGLGALVASAESSLGIDADETRALRVAWERALRGAGELEAAYRLLTEDVERATRLFGTADARTLSSRMARAQTAEDLGLAAEAAAELEEILPDVERVFGSGSGRACVLLVDLADALIDLRRLEEAYALLQEALPCVESTLDPSSPTRILARANYAVVLEHFGDGVGALELRREAWRAAERYFGGDDPRTIEHALGTAILLQEAGRPAEGLEVAERVADLRRGWWGPGDPRTLESLELLAKCCHDLGDHERSLEVSREVFAARTSTLGPEHPVTLRVQNEVATILADLGRLEEALEEGERILSIHRRILPPHDKARTILLGNLCGYARQAGQYELAVDYAREAHELASAYQQDDSFTRALAALDYGELEATLGRHAEARALLEEATEQLRTSPGSHPELRGRGHGNLGIVLWHLGDLEAARAEIELAIGFHERSGDETSRGMLQAMLADLEELIGD